ncbi:MAG TPA: VOC family protein [Pyrinomonadaceae bacterium]|nr:VOC family protein [Pyrinomonadaceae bacterium]
MKIRFTRLNHVQLTIPAGAEGEAREFYGGLLGLEEIEKPGSLKGRGGLWFRMADVQLHLGVEEPQARTKRHPAFEVEEIDRVREYLQSRGVALRDEVDVPGVKRFSFFDPFGNRVELMEVTGGAY